MTQSGSVQDFISHMSQVANSKQRQAIAWPWRGDDGDPRKVCVPDKEMMILPIRRHGSPKEVIGYGVIMGPRDYAGCAESTIDFIEKLWFGAK